MTATTSIHTHTHWLRMLKHIHIQTHFHFIKLMNFMQHDQLKWNIVIKESIVAKEGERAGERAMCVLNLLIIVFLFVILSFGFQSVPYTLTRSFFPIFCVTLKNNWSLEFNQINRFSPFLKFQPNKEPRNRALIQTVCRSNGCLCAMYMSKQHTLAWGRCCWFFVHFGQSICEGRQHIYYWHTVFSCAFFVHDFTWHIYCLFQYFRISCLHSHNLSKMTLNIPFFVVWTAFDCMDRILYDFRILIFTHWLQWMYCILCKYIYLCKNRCD